MNRQKDDIANITVGIALFNQQRDKVFLIKRKPNELFPEKYGIPGGKIKFGENIESAIIRELYEETHIIVDDPLYIKSYKSEGIYLFVYSAISNEDNESFIPIEDINALELAPNISDAIKDSLLFWGENNSTLNVNTYNLINDIINRIAQNVITINKKIGWDHFIKQRRIGTIGTSIGLSILNNTEKYGDLKRKACKTLTNSQLVDGGWGVKSSNNKFSITESTCNCIIAIYDYSIQFDECIKNAKKWLVENMLNDFSWGCNKHSSQGRITSTCLAIQTLFRIDPIFSLQTNIEWLLKGQNKDGGWGFTLNSQSNLTATSLVISTLIKFLSKNDTRILKAVRWIEKELKKDIVKEESEFEYIGDSRFEYKHSTTIYILRALVEQKGINNISPTFLYKSIYSIISERNQNGFWEHSLTPNYFPIWHTNNILRFLLLLLKEEDLLNFSYIQKIYENNRLQLDLIRFLETQASPHKEEETTIYY